jgi:phosphohistidine phosphatase
VYNARLYEADGATLLRIVQNLDDTQPHIKKLMLVGHNPGLTHLAYLLTALSVTDNLPTCATLGVQIPIDTWRALPQTQNTSVFIYDYPKRYPNLQNEPKSTEL